MSKNILISEDVTLHFGKGLISLALSFFFSISSLLAVLAFRFPEYLTSPWLRDIYSESFARGLLFGGMVLSAVFALIAVTLSRNVYLPSISFGILLVATLLGGYKVDVGDVADKSIYLGIDFTILNLLVYAILFIFIEKVFGHYKEQKLFRKEWGSDLVYFVFNHLFISIFLIIINTFVAQFSFAASASLQEFIRSLHGIVQFLLILLVADFMQYWSHRAYHEIPALWKFHAVHHSAKEMDWLAASRVHVVELLLTRAFILLPIVLLGFDTSVVNIYLVFVAFQAVFDHANVSVNPGLFRYIFVTPNFHHWHHSQDQEALDKNYAAHYSFLDYIFGTAVNSQKMWPKEYGVLGDYVPTGFIPQFIFPFKSNYEAFKKYLRKTS